MAGAGAGAAQAAVTTAAPVADASVGAAGRAHVLRDRAYVRFRVPAVDGAVTTARLRLRAAAARRAGVDVLVLPKSAHWSERGLRARNAPRGGRVVGRVKRVRRGTFEVKLSVGKLRLKPGKRVDLAIVSRPCARTRCPRPLTLASREAGARGPRLRLKDAVPTVAAAGDIACDPGYNVSDAFHCQQRATSDLLAGGGYDRILALGDNQYDNGTLDAFNAVFHPTWGRFKALISPVAGNHEYQDPAGGAQGYFDYFNGVGQATGPAGTRGAGWYEFTLGDWHLIALNSDCAAVGGCGLGSAQETWLKTALAGSSAQCTLVYWHHPRFSSGNGGNATAMQQIWQELVDAKADLVLNGHSHGYEQFDPMNATGASDAAGVQEIVVGTGGEDFYPMTNPMSTSRVRIADTFGVLRLSLRPAAYDWRFISTAGKTLTQGSRACQ
jgi:hypothetical protein